jgi:hypothetical protein
MRFLTCSTGAKCMGRNAGEKTWAAEKPFLLNVSHVYPEPVLAKISLFCKENAVPKKGPHRAPCPQRAARKSISVFECCPYVCPEPVLVRLIVFIHY